MKIYHFSELSPITTALIDDGGAKDGIHAVLTARAGAPAGNLASVRRALDAAGMFVVGDMDAGAHVLRVYDLHDPTRLLDILHGAGMIHTRVVSHDATHRAKSLSQNIQDISVKGAGLGYTVADLALIGSGYMSGRYKECLTGSIFSVGSMLLARYGNKSSERHLNDVSCKLGQYLRESGYDLGQDGPVTLARLKHCDGFTRRIEQFMYAYPTQAFNTFVAVAGVPLILSGVQHKKFFDGLAGAFVTGGALCGLLIPERKPDTSIPDEEKTHWRRVKEWVQERPLRIPSILWAANNVALFTSAMKERMLHPEQKSYRFKFAGVAANLFANALTFISSKDEATGFVSDASNVSTLEAVAVQMMLAQPKEKQHEVIDQIAGFLSAQPEVKIPAARLAKEMREKITALEQSPWYSPPTITQDIMAEKRHAMAQEQASWAEKTHTTTPAGQRML